MSEEEGRGEAGRSCEAGERDGDTGQRQGRLREELQ